MVYFGLPTRGDADLPTQVLGVPKMEDLATRDLAKWLAPATNDLEGNCNKKSTPEQTPVEPPKLARASVWFPFEANQKWVHGVSMTVSTWAHDPLFLGE